MINMWDSNDIDELILFLLLQNVLFVSTEL